MKDAAFWVAGIIILMALFNRDCRCGDYMMYYFGSPNPPGANP